MDHHKQHRRITRFLLVASLLLGGQAYAQITFNWVTVGDPGNAADTFVMDKGRLAGTSGYGSVDYPFRIAKEHVTNTQYASFLNAADPSGANSLDLYNSNMTLSTIGVDGRAYTGGIDFDSSAADGLKYSTKDGQANYPATWINWYSSARFVNWLSNGQGSGDTESGIYNMSETFPSRGEDATVFIPSEDEFYKAAYYDPTKDGGAGGYWDYGIQSDSPPTSEAPPGGGNSANSATERLFDYWQHDGPFDDSRDYLVDVGSYPDAVSHYGLLDVDGQVYQWTEAAVLEDTFLGPRLLPIHRGGAWYEDTRRTGRGYRNSYSFPESTAYHWYGLRVAALPDDSVPTGDFDSNGTFDCADINALGTEIAAGTNDAVFDLTGDGIVDLADRDAWLVAGGAAELASGGAFPVGDANLNGAVDSTDLGLLLNNFGASGDAVYCGGDLNVDTHVDSTDLGLLLNNFGAAAVAVPEPQSVLLLLAGLLTLKRNRE